MNALLDSSFVIDFHYDNTVDIIAIMVLRKLPKKIYSLH